MLLDCKHCNALVEAPEVATHFDRVSDLNDLPGKWTLAYCPRCTLPMLAVQEDFGEGFEHDTPVRVCPAPTAHLGASVPQSIRAAFTEAVKCFNAKAYSACAIMCRKALEGLCAEHGATERSLALSLKRLKAEGVIEDRLFQWAEALRHFGNEAAHGSELKSTRKDAADTLEFTEALAEYVFTYREKFEQFRQRRLPPKPAT